MKKLARYLFSFFLISSFLFSEIEVISSLQEISPLIEREDLLFLEIDNVLLKPNEYLASTQYLDYLKEKLLRSGEEASEIASQLYPLWVKIIQSATMELVDLDIPGIFNEIREKDALILGLSHRGPSLSITSHDTLHDLGLFFDMPFHFNKGKFFEKGLANFLEGLLFIHPICDKGKYIKKFLGHHQLTPKRVVVVDYELVNLVEMKQAMEEMNIPFLGLFYHSHEDEMNEEVVEVANTQLKYLGTLIPDLEAKYLVQECGSQN